MEKSNFIFSLGEINKKLILPIVLSINTIVRMIIFYFLDLNDDDKYFFISTYWAEGIGALLIMLVPFIIRYKGKKKKEKKNCKTKFKEYIGLIAFYLIYQAMVAVGNFKGIKFLENNLYASTPFTLMILLITLETFFFLKYKYYIHHIICLVIFCLLSLCIDIMLENYKNIKFDEIIYYIVYMIGSTLYMFYVKYMLEKLYYLYWELVCVPGSFDIIIGTICYFITGFSNNDYFSFNNIDVKNTILKFFLLLFFAGFNNTFICVLIIDQLTPNHVLISLEVVNIFFVVVSDKQNKYFTLIPYFFQVAVLLFFLEILEFNFCGLNENTKKNIQRRGIIESGKIESAKFDRVDSEIELGQGYILDSEDATIDTQFSLRTKTKEIDN